MHMIWSISRKRKLALKRAYPIYLLMLPGIVSTFVFCYIPMYGIQIAFKNYRMSLGMVKSSWVGLGHFIRYVTYIGFWPMIKNTLSITLYSLAVWPLTIVVALQINELRSIWFKKTVQMVSYAPHFISTVVECGMVILFLNRGNGIVNNVIALCGGTRIDFLASESMFADIYVWSGVWKTIGWDTIIYLAALSSISPELVEAAQIDGASRLKIIKYVNIPGILPTVAIMLILRTGGLLSVGYEKIMLLQTNLNLGASRVISTYVYETGIEGGQLDYSTAISFFNNIVNIVVIFIVNSISKKTAEVSLW